VRVDIRANVAIFSGISYIASIAGFTPSTGHFTIHFNADESRPIIARSYLMTRMLSVDLTGMHNLVLSSLGAPFID